MAGKSQAYIARTLTKEGIPAPRGGAVWHPKTIDSILRNEKYKGAALLQKKYTVDFLQKKTKVNEGEVPQYYVEESHPAIIVSEEWDKVQVELERRRDYPRIHSKNSAFSGMIYCGDCGARYSPITWHSTDKYRRIVSSGAVQEDKVDIRKISKTMITVGLIRFIPALLCKSLIVIL